MGNLVCGIDTIDKTTFLMNGSFALLLCQNNVDRAMHFFAMILYIHATCCLAVMCVDIFVSQIPNPIDI